MTKEEVVQLIGCEGRDTAPFGGYTKEQQAQHEVWVNWNNEGPESGELLLVFRDGKLANWPFYTPEPLGRRASEGCFSGGTF